MEARAGIYKVLDSDTSSAVYGEIDQHGGYVSTVVV